MRTLGPKVFILHSQFHCIQFYVIYTIARHLLTWLKGPCYVYKGILTMEVLYTCSSCFTGALANNLWQGLFHSLQKVIRLLNIP